MKLTDIEIKQLKQNKNFVEEVEYYKSELNKLDFNKLPNCISESEAVYEYILQLWQADMIGNLIDSAQQIIDKDDWTDEDWEKALFDYDVENDVCIDFPMFNLW